LSIERLCKRGERLCRNLAPIDLAGVPLYIVPQSRIGGTSTCDGYTALSLDLHLREYIDDYCGRGPCMVVNDMALVEHDPAGLEPAFLVVVVHELAHILERRCLFYERTETADDIAEEAKQIQRAVSSEAFDADVAFWHHGHRFIRIALHLAYRASRFGVPTAPGSLCAGRRYEQSHACQYSATLGREPKRLMRVSFRTLERIPPPDNFQSLWTTDTLAWIDSHLPSLQRSDDGHDQSD
jgi:hypothetical protein